MSINRDEFHAALSRLEGLAKGQLYHTPSDSNPGSWAGTGQTDQNEHEDGIDDNGTDYNGVKKALANKVSKSKALTPAEVLIVKGEDPRRAIADKIAKGGKLTQAESWAVKKGFPFDKDDDDDDKDDMDKTKKSGTAKASTTPGKAPASGTEDDAPKAPETNAGTSKQEDIEPDAKKSLHAATQTQPNLRKGIEMSPILYEMTRAIGVALEGAEARTIQAVNKAINNTVGSLVARVEALEKSFGGFANHQDTFNKGFAEAVIGIGQQLAGGVEVNAAAASAPVGGPKSHLRALPGGQQQPGQPQVMQKSFGPGGLDVSSDQINKAQITNTMFELVKKGQMNQLDLVKFDSTGEMSPAVRGLVAQAMGGAQ